MFTTIRPPHEAKEANLHGSFTVGFQAGAVLGRGGSEAAAEVDDVAVLDDVVLAFEPLEVLGLHFLHRAGAVQVVEGGDLGADEAPGEVGVDLAGGLDGACRRARGSSRGPRARRR